FMVRELYRLLRPGGTAIVSTPNNQRQDGSPALIVWGTAIVSTPNNESWRSILALLGRGHFVAFIENCYPAHITALLRMDITRIFLEAKFQSPRFYFTDYGGIPKSPSV